MDENMFYDQRAEESWPAHVHLAEDNFVLVEVNPAQLAGQALEHWRQAKGEKVPRPSDIYRQWAKRLREQATPEALEVLRELMLETTVPFNELESPSWIDSYTGEVISEDDDEWAGRSDKTDLPFMPVNEWQEFLVTRVRQSYADPEVAAKAMAASSEWVGVEDEDIVLDDRGYEPPTFSESVFTTDALPLLRTELETVAAALRASIRRQVERGGGQSEIQARVRASTECVLFLLKAQEMLTRDEAIQDVFILVRPFTHGLCLTDEDWARLKTKDPARQNLLAWAVDFEDMVNQSEEAGPLVHHGIGQQELEDIADQFLKDLVSTVPIEGDTLCLDPGINPILRSRYYVEGFIRAQINGADNPALEAWRHWRRKTSTAGALAYDAELKRHGDRKLAMSAFWRAAAKAGDVKTNPKVVAAMKPTGLRLDGGREISWSTACKIAATEGFVDQQRLAVALSAKGWGKGLVQVIERQASPRTE